jgi:hypothetical protein
VTQFYTHKGIPSDLLHGGVVDRRAMKVTLMAQSGELAATDYRTLVREGRLYSLDTCVPGVSPIVADNATRTMMVIPTSDNAPVITIGYVMEGAGTFSLWVVPQADYSGGTAIPAVNLDHNSNGNLQAVVLRDPVITTLNNSQFKGAQLVQGAGLGAGRSGSQADRTGHVLRPGEAFLMRLLNTSGGAVRACINAEIYNSPVRSTE